jgi:hypothetical protein
MTPKKDVAAVVKAAESQNFQVRRTRRGDYRFFTAEGVFICDLGGTPSSNSEVSNKKAKLKKHGFRD